MHVRAQIDRQRLRNFGQTEDGSDHATRERRERPGPDRDDLRWGEKHDDALDECEEPDQGHDPPGDAAEAGLVQAVRHRETPAGELSCEGRKRCGEVETGPEPERDVSMVELVPVDDGNPVGMVSG